MARGGLVSILNQNLLAVGLLFGRDGVNGKHLAIRSDAVWRSDVMVGAWQKRGKRSRRRGASCPELLHRRHKAAWVGLALTGGGVALHINGASNRSNVARRAASSAEVSASSTTRR